MKVQRELTPIDMIKIAQVDQQINKIQKYFRSIELKEEDNLFEVMEKFEKMNAIKVHKEIVITCNASVDTIRDLEHMYSDNTVVKVEDTGRYYVVLKRQVIIEVNTKANNITVSMWNTDTPYEDQVIYIAPKGADASFFISAMYKQLENKKEKVGI